MTFGQFREQRLNELLADYRVPGGGLDTEPGLNNIKGLLDLINYAKPKSVLEIGSHRGISTECFLLNCPRVVALDSWEGNWSNYFMEFLDRCGEYPNLEIVRGRSPESLAQFLNGEFDLVYIDGDHSEYAATCDIRESKRLARRWLAGHDFIETHNCAVPAAVRKLLGEPSIVFDDTSWLIKL